MNAEIVEGGHEKNRNSEWPSGDAYLRSIPSSCERETEDSERVNMVSWLIGIGIVGIAMSAVGFESWQVKL